MTEKKTQAQALVLTVEELAEKLNITTDLARAMIHDGSIRAIRIGRVWRIPAKALDEYLERQDNPREAFTIDEVAQAININRNIVSGMIQEGEIRAVKAGRSWRIPLTALSEFLDRRDNPEREDGKED